MIRRLLPWAVAICLVSLIAYGFSWWFYPQESGDAAAWRDALITGTALAFIGSLLFVIVGTLVSGLRRTR